MTAEQQAAELLKAEVYHWGQKGLETTQRVSIHVVQISSQLHRIGASRELLDYWYEVNKWVYKLGK